MQSLELEPAADWKQQVKIRMTERELFDPALNELGDSRSHNGDSEVSELVAGLVLVYSRVIR